ncbi:hypothetical protein GCM10009838_81350 [Catenulispora subtropica]|uniref:Uncharacterized protein n=2 Tax=Catenulispora subtropica TaxID=450798 RepID=A0ABP5ENN8_9ACTN
MTRTIIDLPDAAEHSEAALREQLTRSAAGADCLQHANIRVRAGSVVFTLFLIAADRVDAAMHAEQLCRRTMASVAADERWSVRSTSAGP